MVGVEREIMIAQDVALQQWIGVIMSDKSLYENAEFDWFAWCNNSRHDLNRRAVQTGNFTAIEEARKIARLGAMTAQEVYIPSQAEQMDPVDELVLIEASLEMHDGVEQAA